MNKYGKGNFITDVTYYNYYKNLGTKMNFNMTHIYYKSE